MQTIGNTQFLAITAREQQKGNDKKPLTGFQLHPENINRAGYVKRDWTFKGLIEEALEEQARTTDGKIIPWKKAFVKKLLNKAILEGETKAMEVIMDRLDGKSLQPIDHTTLGEKMPGPIVYQPQEDK